MCDVHLPESLFQLLQQASNLSLQLLAVSLQSCGVGVCFCDGLLGILKLISQLQYLQSL